MFARLAFISSLVIGSVAGPLLAQDANDVTGLVGVTTTAEPVNAPPKLVFTVRGGFSARPEYFGSDDFQPGPDFSLRLNYVTFGNQRFGSEPEGDEPQLWAQTRLFSFGPSFRYISERDPDEHDELEGLDKVDQALELGVTVGYAQPNYLAFAKLRRGFGGHEGWVGELGADALYSPNKKLLLSLGPRVLFGDNEFSDTYFGITPPESSAALPSYDPDGGIISAGLELGIRYRVSENWGIEGAVTWDRFQGDAVDSPIVRQGSEDQWRARIGLTRVFSIGG